MIKLIKYFLSKIGLIKIIMTNAQIDEIRSELFKVSEDADFCNCVIDELITSEKNGKLVIQSNQNQPRETDKPIAGLRLFNSNLYISLHQLKRNITNNIFVILFTVICSPFKGLTLATQISAQVIASCHLVTSDESCVFIKAIEFFKENSKSFHSINDFIKDFASQAVCIDKNKDCKFIVEGVCKINEKAIIFALNSLTEKNILERNGNNEYRYRKW